MPESLLPLRVSVFVGDGSCTSSLVGCFLSTCHGPHTACIWDRGPCTALLPTWDLRPWTRRQEPGCELTWLNVASQSLAQGGKRC